MDWFSISAILITLAAVFTYLNHRFLKLPGTIALTAMSLVVALSLVAADRMGFGLEEHVEGVLREIDFGKLLLEAMLGFLLFAAALHVDLNDLAKNKLEIATFATVGVLGSTALVGGMVWGLSSAMGLGLQPIHCFLFGALISPTDLIAVLGLVRKAGGSKTIQTQIAGESLFNDGIGVVVFLTLLKIASGSADMTAGGIALLFAQEAVGGVVLGLVAGWLAYRALKSIDNYRVENLVTLALVAGGYALAHAIHVSGPIAMVVAGLLIGNHGKRLAMSERTREHLETFWELVDELLNALLFVLIGLEALVLTGSTRALLAGAIAIPIVLVARGISIGVPVSMLRLRRPFEPRAIRVLTWGGLRGGISVALALSLPYVTQVQSGAREMILTMTYIVVVFSILVQGLTLKAVLRPRASA